MPDDADAAPNAAHPFANIRSRPSVDYVLRTAQQHHVSLSILADTKASFVITISSIVLTIALSRSGQEQIRPALLTLAAACLLSLVLAIIAVLPTFTSPRMFGRQATKNILFFGHFGEMTEAEYMDEISKIIESDPLLYEAAVRDIYSLGRYLYRKKYRFLRYAYLSLLLGFILATAVQVWVAWK